MFRRFWVFIHRWLGLAMTAFLVVVGLTGSVIAFREELDAWLNPELLTVARRDAPLLDPITLRDKAAALYPDEQFDQMIPLQIAADRAVAFIHAKSMSADDHAGENFNEILLDPYSGEKLGERPLSSGPSLERKNLISFLYNLHYSLAVPSSWGSLGGNNVGGLVLGLVALVWTIDCFIAFYLTFPLRLRSTAAATRPAKSWWSRWKPAWLIKTNAGLYRLNFDVHRAFGLWTWAMLFVFAWSSVGFNWSAVYGPTMDLLFGAPPAASAPAPARAKKTETPALGWRDALEQGDRLLQAEAGRRGLKVEAERYLSLSRDDGVYTLVASLSGDVNRRGANSLSFDADTGALTQVDFESELRRRDAIANWLAQLHMAGVFGLSMQIFVCAMGFVITALCVTGVYIWWKKRKARARHRATAHEEAPAPIG